MTELFSQDSFYLATLCHIGVGIISGLIIAVSYILSDSRKNYSINFAITTVILPAVTAIVITLVGSDLAKAISIGGVFALVRFRSVPGDSRDILYVFFAMAAGLAVGMNLYAVAITVSFIISLIFVILKKISGTQITAKTKILKITMPENMNFKTVFDDLFVKYLNSWELTEVKTTNMGTLFAVTYTVKCRKDIDEKAFLDEIRIRNGNLNIILGSTEDLAVPVL